MTSTKHRFLFTLVFLLGSTFPLSSFSEEYQFNNEGKVKQEFDKSINFKLPESNDQKTVDLVSEVENKSLYQTPLGYPKKEVYASFNPSFNGFKNILSSTRTYNYGGANFTGLTLGFAYHPDLESFFTAEASTSTISIASFNDTSAGLKISSSSAQLPNISLGGNFCTIYESAFHKFCPGFEIALDSFPTLDFPQNNNSLISLKSVQDMTVGMNVVYSRSLSRSFLMKLKAAYNYGLKMGQADTLGTKSDQKVALLARIEWPQTSSSTYLDFKADYRSATMKSSQDTWDIQNASYAINLGMKWEFGSN